MERMCDSDIGIGKPLERDMAYRKMDEVKIVLMEVDWYKYNYYLC